MSGANIGYVRLLVGYLDQAANSLYVIDRITWRARRRVELNGVYYPDWGARGVHSGFRVGADRLRHRRRHDDSGGAADAGDLRRDG